MGESTVKVGVVDIGTNSMRLLITDGRSEIGRWVEVTGLGRGVDSTGRLSAEGIDASLEALVGYGRLMGRAAVERRMAMATSACRDASNREAFFDQAETALGVRPELLTGEEEGRLAFAGAATSGFDLEEPVAVSDIGGGSTEVVTRQSTRSIDIGSVRLTERFLSDRPPSEIDMDASARRLTEMFAALDTGSVSSHIGVAGTWTSLSAIAQDLPGYQRDRVHHSVLTHDAAVEVAGRLSKLSLEETRSIPSLDPRRAPVILAGALIAVAVMERLGVEETMVSERDTLDGAAMELIGIP